VSEPRRTTRAAAAGPAAGEARIGPPHEQASGAPLPVTVVPRRGHRRVGAHTPPGQDARPVTVVAFDSRQLRRSVVTVLVVVTLWLIVLGVFAAIGHFLFILMLSWLFAIAMEPAILRLTARGVRRGTATGIVGSLVLVCVIALAALFGNLFFQQLAQLITSLPTTVTQTVSWANTHLGLKLDPTTIADQLRLTPEQVGNWTTRIAGGVVGIVTQLLSLLLEVFTFFVFAFYIAAAGPRIRRSIGRWMPPQRQEVFVTVWDIAARKTGGYVISKVVLAALSAVFHAVFFWAIGVPYWLPLALLVGITAQFIPVVGTYIGIAVPLLFVVFTMPLTAVWIIVFATVYQQIETYLFTPRISNRTMDVNSGIALAAVFIGAAIWGPIGALIGIPLAAAVVAVVGTYGRRYELVPQLAAEFQDDEDEEDEDDAVEDHEVEDHDVQDHAVEDHAVENHDDAGGTEDEHPPAPDEEPSAASDESAPVLSRPSAP
jgi:predicted PurR-regulated permease PerM